MKEKIILKSANPEQYGDIEIECRVIQNDEIGSYLESIPEERKFYAYKSAAVVAMPGVPGEKVSTVLKTVVDGKEYILSEEENYVKERTYSKVCNGKTEEVTEPDYIVTNINSTSNERYIVKAERMETTYDLVGASTMGGIYTPKYDSRLLTQVLENVIIVTSWGAKAVCLKGGYIVTYNASNNDYNVIEQGAFNSTYVRDTASKSKSLKRS